MIVSHRSTDGKRFVFPLVPMEESHSEAVSKWGSDHFETAPCNLICEIGVGGQVVEIHGGGHVLKLPVMDTLGIFNDGGTVGKG